jgi:pantoate--beta-alanine ligase
MMRELDQFTEIAALRARLDEVRAAGRRVGFVPTMGYLHDGHASLIRASADACDVTVVSIFVNPLQFAPGEDLEAYPRDLPRDLELVREAGADLVFHPAPTEMYPTPIATTVTVQGVSEGLEGASRPTHFAGVATVVAKLFSIVGPCRAFFGEKDFQQLAVVRRMVADLSMPVDVVGCPTAREHDGLARSSRNVYLTADERAAAPVLHRALLAGRAAILAGERDPASVEATMAEVLAGEPLVAPDYVVAVDAVTLHRPDVLRDEVRLLVAGRLGKPRLLDNLGVTIPSD